MTRSEGDECACGHVYSAHTHYRPGSDCALCADRSCVKFRSAGRSPRLSRLLGRGASRRGAEALSPEPARARSADPADDGPDAVIPDAVPSPRRAERNQAVESGQ